jgi:ABC-2 type transport system ATP-binding protein
MPAIKTTDLVKRFSDVTAVDGVSLEIPEGEVFGLLGPNGAGKTTLISMLATLIRPTSGTASVAGFDTGRHPLEVRKNIGIVFQEPSVDDLLTGRENLHLRSAPRGDRPEDGEDAGPGQPHRPRRQLCEDLFRRHEAAA